jgi:tetratricopeptide (TPR) repeat protein
MGEFLAQAGRLDEAREILAEAWELAQRARPVDRMRVLNTRVLVERLSGDMAQALAAIEALGESDRQAVDSALFLTQWDVEVVHALAGAGRFDEALAVEQRALERVSVQQLSSARLLLDLSAARIALHGARGQPAVAAGAVEALRRQRALAPGYAAACEAEWLSASGRHDEARALAQAALAANDVSREPEGWLSQRRLRRCAEAG